MTDRRKKMQTREALNICEESRWQCDTCNAPALEDENYCLSCKLYWQDVENGLFDA